MANKTDCQRCNKENIECYTKLCEKCEKEFTEEYYEEQDKYREETYESIRRSMY